ncbi:MAG: dicarboxylate/amino acid:cation symporter [bacterium]
MKLWQKILIGFCLGALVGLIAGPQAAAFKPLGDLFIRLIKMLIVPLVFSSLVIGASSMGDLRKLGRVGAKTLAYYLITTAVAVIIGLVLAAFFNPGAGFSIPANSYEANPHPDLLDSLINVVPASVLAAMVPGNMLQIITFALFMGIAITLAGEPAKTIHSFFDGLAETMYKMTTVVIEFVPVGVFALMAWVMAINGPGVLLPLSKVILLVYLGCFLQAVLVYSPLLSVLARMHPLRFFRGFFDASLVAFSTCSSSATLPVSMRCAQENLGVPKDIASFVLPLGATINMDGTALYQGICALFIAQVYGISMGITHYVAIILTATLASIGTAGVPGAGMIMLTMVLNAAGLPLDGILLIAGIDRVLDMARTCINVTGDGAGAVIIAATEEHIKALLARKGFYS